MHHWIAAAALPVCILLGPVFFCSCAHGPGKSDGTAQPAGNFEAARTLYQHSDHSETARREYVGTLASLAWTELPQHRSGERHECRIDAINAELLRHPAPPGADTRELVRLLPGKWQSPRRTYLFAGDGTWKMAPEDGTGHERWQIDGNRFLQDGTQYTLIVLNKDSLVYTDGMSVFHHHRAGK